MYTLRRLISCPRVLEGRTHTRTFMTLQRHGGGSESVFHQRQSLFWSQLPRTSAQQAASQRRARGGVDKQASWPQSPRTRTFPPPDVSLSTLSGAFEQRFDFDSTPQLDVSHSDLFPVRTDRISRSLTL